MLIGLPKTGIEQINAHSLKYNGNKARQQTWTMNWYVTLLVQCCI